jgi:addiction module RelE/StbE family toxin
LKVRWTRPALVDFIEAQTFIGRHDPTAAQQIARRLWEAVEGLKDHPQIGRPGHAAGTRERVVPRTPYLIVYRVANETVDILRLWHGRRNWQSDPTAGHSPGS